MGISVPHILQAKVMHKRFIPKVNAFSYALYYLAFPLSQRSHMPMAYNKFGFLSFYDRDHGARDGSDLQNWASNILNDYGFDSDLDITLICMPRVMGYVFNPVSFWLCRDKEKNLRAVLCEVHNTFGEHHIYICAHDDQSAIKKTDTLTAKKVFHVSPFLKREGHYTFRFQDDPDNFGVWIDFYNAQGDKQLITSLLGSYKKMTRQTLRSAILKHPLVTFKAITLIHWQAVKLVFKGIKYISKPLQKPRKVSVTDNLTKL